MNTQEFLERILPHQGVYFIAYQPTKDRAMRHVACQTKAELAKKILELDQNSYAVYHACASYKQARVVDADGKKRSYRVAENRDRIRSFWLDLDVGADKASTGKGYATKREACTALAGFCKKYKLPNPLVVSSGYGIHAYFIMNKDLEREEWKDTASKLKALLYKESVWADPTRTADDASILRPVGSTNKKHGTPVAVTALLEQKAPIRYEAFKAVIDKATKDLPIAGQGKSSAAPEFTAEPDDPSVKKVWQSEFVKDFTPKADADLCCEGCEQMRIMRDTKGDVDYKTMANIIGVLRQCKDGYRIAHEWTADRLKNHDQGPEAVDRIWNTFSADYATSCARFEQDNPEPCLRCPNRGKVFNPGNLGRLTDAQLVQMEVEEAHTPEPEAEPVSGEFGAATASEAEVDIVPGYYWGGDEAGLLRVVEGKKGGQLSRSFCKTRFKVVDRTVNADGEMQYVFTKCDPFTKAWQDFAVESAGCTGQDLIRNLAKYGVISTGNNDSDGDMKAYVKDSIAAINLRIKATRSVPLFGWQDDGAFVIGSRLYKKGQDSWVRVLLDKSVKKEEPFFPDPVGTAEGYAAAFNAVYANKGMEPFQYAICSLWGSPLVALCNSEYRGIPCALTGIESGVGKTTAARAAFYAFGDSTIGTTSGFAGTTESALINRLSRLKNLPLVLDEMTDGSKTKYSELLYRLASGSNRDRSNSDGSSKDRLCWWSQSIITGNSNIVGSLVLDDSNASAQQMRIFEISIDDYPGVKKFSDPNFVSNRMREMEQNLGAAGDVFIKYVVNHTEEIRHRLEEILDPSKNQDCVGVLFIESQARFYRYHIACSLVAAEIMAKLGVSQLDMAALRKFAIAQGNRLVELSLSQRKDALTLIRDILSSLADYTLITDHFGCKPAKVIAPPKKGLATVRLVNSIAANANAKGNPNAEVAEAGYEQYDNTIIVRTDEINKYLMQHREGSLVSFKKELLRIKALKAHRKLIPNLGAPEVTGYRGMCFVLDLKVISPDLFTGVTNEDQTTN